MEIPSWLSSYLKPGDVEPIVQAIRDSESTTSGELVPMIVRRSSTVGHVPVILMCVLVALFFALDVSTWQMARFGEHWAWYLVDAILLVGATAVGSRRPLIQRWLTSRADQALQVNSRAMNEFYESNIYQTRDSTGILILVSLMERRAVVLADKAINDRVPKETWQDVCQQLVAGIKSKSLGHAISDAVLKCGEIMAPHFPVKPDDENELKDELVIKE